MAAPSQFSGGIQVPVQSDSTGGLRLLSGDEYVIQTVRILCGDGDSDNPFNTGVGVGHSAVFQAAGDTAWKTKARQEIEDVFRDLERAQVAKLRGVSLVQSNVPEEFEALVEFLSIETNTTLEIDTTIRRT